MRASNFSLVFATGCSLLWAVGAQDPSGPGNVGVIPSILTASATFTVTWDGCNSPCAVIGAALLEIYPSNQGETTRVPLTAHDCVGSNEGVPAVYSCFTGIAPQLATTNAYEIDIEYQTISGSAPTAHVNRTLPATDINPGAGGTSSTLSTPTPSVTPPSTANGRATPTTGPQVPPSISKTISASPSVHALPSAATSTGADLGNTNDSSGLSTGAKVGIAIGAVGFALLVLIAALLLWRRSRQRQLRALPNGMPYSHDIGSTNRDFTAEKEMQVISSPVDTLHNGYSSIPPVAETQSRSQRGSYPLPDGHAAADAAPYTDAHRESHGSGFEDSASPVQETQAHPPPAAAAGAAIQRKPVGAATGPTHHLREPGMSDEEVARLEEEERRLDEAIAEAERRRQLQG